VEQGEKVKSIVLFSGCLLAIIGCQGKNASAGTPNEKGCASFEGSMQNQTVDLGEPVLNEAITIDLAVSFPANFGKGPYRTQSTCGCVASAIKGGRLKATYTPTVTGQDQQFITITDENGMQHVVALNANVQPRVSSDPDMIQLERKESAFWQRNITLTFGKKVDKGLKFQAKDCYVESQSWQGPLKLIVDVRGTGVRPKAGNGYLAISDENFFLPILFAK